MYTKEQIQENITTNIKWMVRTIEILFDRQTLDEQETKTTGHNNGMGFTGADAYILTSFYEQIQKRRDRKITPLLSEKQIQMCQKKLPKYWRQVKEEIEAKSRVTA